MIFDHRTYTCKPGSIKAHLDLYEKMGFAPQSRLLGKPVLYGTTEVGDVNSYVHVWAYIWWTALPSVRPRGPIRSGWPTSRRPESLAR
jgi:hypothetical protein